MNRRGWKIYQWHVKLLRGRKVKKASPFYFTTCQYVYPLRMYIFISFGEEKAFPCRSFDQKTLENILHSILRLSLFSVFQVTFPFLLHSSFFYLILTFQGPRCIFQDYSALLSCWEWMKTTPANIHLSIQLKDFHPQFVKTFKTKRRVRMSKLTFPQKQSSRWRLPFCGKETKNCTISYSLSTSG